MFHETQEFHDQMSMNFERKTMYQGVNSLDNTDVPKVHN
jgi:hypothetical protein